MSTDLENQDLLFKTLSSSGQVTYLCGAGFSMALGEHSFTWADWINKGLDYIEQERKDKILYLLLNSGTDSLIEAASLLINELKRIDRYNEFMEATIGAITPKQNKIIEALNLIVRNGDLIATTNYDLGIEKAVNLQPITYNNAGEELKILKREAENKVLHLHGVYLKNGEINDIIATSEQYERIIGNEGAQFIQNLLSTQPLIIIGCGGTVDDPNLKNFLQFSQKYLKLDVPYFYLYCKKDVLKGLSDKVIPVCYGNNYTDLPDFLLNITMRRIKENLNIKKVCRINPYVQVAQNTSAYSRMHYTAKYLDFIGREKERSELNDFVDAGNKFLWWMVTGEAGMGKSRLVLEWLCDLPSDWFGFFADIEADFYNFKPFSNTVIVLDYVAEREKACARIIAELIEIFKASSYKVRILLVERHYEPDKKGWFYKLVQAFKPNDKIFFESRAYSKNNSISPLQLGKLTYEEEKEYIKNYLEKYVKEPGMEGLKEIYLKNINNSVKKIHKSFKKTLKSVYQRPLYLSIFIEVWVDKSGELSVKNSEELLECYLEKEEMRLLERFGNDRKVLNAYLKLLSLACVTGVLCVNEENYYYQKQSDTFYNYLLSVEQTGRLKNSLTDIFVTSEFNEKNISELYYIIKPLYPDIIKEFIVLYYIDREESRFFAKTARHVSVIQLSMFLMYALDDFPDNEKFVEMIMTEPDEDCEYFDYFLGLIASMFDLTDYDRIINNLLNTSEQVTKDFGIYELYTWRQLAEIQEYRLCEGDVGIDDYMRRAKQFITLVNKKFNLPNVKEYSLEILEIWFRGLHSKQNTELAEEFLILFKELINRMPAEGDILQNAATVYCECRMRMLVLYARGNDYINCKKDIESIEEYLNIFPDDEDIYNAYINAISDYVLKLCKTQKFELIREYLPKLKDLYAKNNDERLADSLAVIYANFFMVRVDEYASKNDNLKKNDEALKTYEKEIDCFLKKYSDSERIAASYVSVKSVFLIAQFIQGNMVIVEEALLNKFRRYYNKWKNNIDIIEGLGRLLYIKISDLIAGVQTQNTARVLLRELEALERASRPVYKEYNTANDELKNFISAIKYVFT